VIQVGYSEGDEEHICLAYEENRWVNLRRECIAGEVSRNSYLLSTSELYSEFR